MVGRVQLETLVNGKPITYEGLRDPFDLALFPGAVDMARGQTLERLGKDISYVTRQLAMQDPDIEDIKVDYKIENGDLVITTEQKNKIDYELREYEATLEGTFSAPNPQLHTLKAAMAVLHNKNQPYLNHQGIAYDIISQWRGLRGRSGGLGSSTGTSSVPIFGDGVAGLAYGLSLWGMPFV